MYGMHFLFVVFLYCNLLQLTKVEGLLLPFLYIHTCVIFNNCIQTLENPPSQQHPPPPNQHHLLNQHCPTASYQPTKSPQPTACEP